MFFCDLPHAKVSPYVFGFSPNCHFPEGRTSSKQIIRKLISTAIIIRQCSFPNPCTRSLFNIIYIHKCMGIVTYKYLYKNNKNKKVPYITIFLQKNPFSTFGCPLNASGLSCLLSRKNIRLYQASSSELLVRHTKSHRKKSLPFIPDLLTAVRTTKIILPYSNVSS